MKLVRENINFKRGQDPRKSLNIGRKEFERLTIEKWIQQKNTFELYNYYGEWAENYYIYADAISIENGIVHFNGYYDDGGSGTEMEGEFQLENIKDLDVEEDIVWLETSEAYESEDREEYEEEEFDDSR